MKDTSNNEKMDISKEEHSEISRQAEEKMDTAQEDDGVGDNFKEEKEMEISDEDFRKFATKLEMDMSKLKEWFVKSKYEAEEFKGFFTEKVTVKLLGKVDKCHPLHVAALRGAVDMVDMLINEAKVDVNIQKEAPEGDSDTEVYYEGCTPLHFAVDGNHGEMVYRLVMTYGADPNVQSRDLIKQTPLHMASFWRCAGAIKGFLRAECESRHPLNVNGTNSPEFPSTKSHKIDVNATDKLGRTALHYVAQYNRWDRTGREVEVVHTLLKFPDIKLTIEDGVGDTALDLASLYENWEVFDILRLKITPEVTDYNEPYYRDRQASVDAANAILVGAALIASVTFAAWLQPPLGYSTDYNEQYSNSFPAPPTSNPQYASFDHHPALNWFWAFNSFSFFMAIATVMSGAQSVLPSHRVTVKQEVAKLQRNLIITSTLMALSMVFVLLAFAIAGVIVVPPVFKLRASMIFTILIGGGVSVVFLCRLVWRIFCTAREMPGRPRSVRIKFLYD